MLYATLPGIWTVQYNYGTGMPAFVLSLQRNKQIAGSYFVAMCDGYDASRTVQVVLLFLSSIPVRYYL